MFPGEHRFHDGKTGAALAIRVIPRAKRNEIAGIMEDGTVKVRLTAPPVEGKANLSLIKFLADILGVSRSDIEIVAGEKGRNKLVTVLNLDSKTVQERLLVKLG